MEDFPANEHHLSTLEQISPQAYVRFILCFRLRSGASHDQVTQILRQGLELTASKITFLNSMVVSGTDSNGRETKDLRQKNINLLTVKDLTKSSLNFEDIRSQGFPSKVFDGGLLCPTAVFAVPEFPAPVFLVQANLITGGLLLGLSVWHGALDGEKRGHSWHACSDMKTEVLVFTRMIRHLNKLQ